MDKPEINDINFDECTADIELLDDDIYIHEFVLPGVLELQNIHGSDLCNEDLEIVESYLEENEESDYDDLP